MGFAVAVRPEPLAEKPFGPLIDQVTLLPPIPMEEVSSHLFMVPGEAVPTEADQLPVVPAAMYFGPDGGDMLAVGGVTQTHVSALKEAEAFSDTVLLHGEPPVAAPVQLIE
jgi:hypothetical protein